MSDTLKPDPAAPTNPTPAPTPPAPTPTNRPVLAWILARLADQPRWVQALAIGLIAAAGAAVQFYRSTPVPLPAPVPQPVINVTLPPAVAPVPQVVADFAGARERVAGQRLFGRMMREKVSAQLQKDGFKLAGGDPTPLSKEKADALVKRLDDEVVVGVYGEVSGDSPEVMRGPVIDFFKRIIEWIRTHPEEFKRIISLLLTILMMFLDVPA